MLKILKVAVYMAGMVTAGMLFTACTQGKIPYASEPADNAEKTTQYFLTTSELSETENFSYIVRDNAIVLKKYSGNDTVVDVPEMIEDKEVRGIEARCFENTDRENAVHTVRIPSTVGNINTLAFYNSKFLENIECIDNMNYLSENGILYTSDRISLIAYPENKVDSVYDMPDTVNKIYSNAFSFGNHLREIRLSANLAVIPDYAFAYNSGIQRVVANGKITHIGFASFCKCENLTEIHFSDTVENINDKAILFCHNLKTVTAEKESTVLKDYAERSNVLYNPTKKQNTPDILSD